MAIDYTIEVKGNLLHVTAAGYDETLEEVVAYGTAVIQACHEHLCPYVLADESRLEYRLSTLDIYELAKVYAELVPLVARTAIVCRPQDLPDARFWEATVSNRGPTVRVFTDVDEAHAWLTAQAGVES